MKLSIDNWVDCTDFLINIIKSEPNNDNYLVTHVTRFILLCNGYLLKSLLSEFRGICSGVVIPVRQINCITESCSCNMDMIRNGRVSIELNLCSRVCRLNQIIVSIKAIAWWKTCNVSLLLWHNVASERQRERERNEFVEVRWRNGYRHQKGRVQISVQIISCLPRSFGKDMNPFPSALHYH